MKIFTPHFAALVSLLAATAFAEDLAVQGETVHTMAGEAIRDGVVLIKDGKIQSIGPAAIAAPGRASKSWSSRKPSWRNRSPSSSQGLRADPLGEL